MFRKPVYYGWWVLAACSITQLYYGGAFFYGFTAFFNPIAKDFPWSYAMISLAATVSGLENGAMSPVVGILVDRYRPRKILLAGAIFGALGFFLFSRIQTLWSFYVACGVLGLTGAMSSQVVVMTAVVTWFREKRTGMAMGILSCFAASSGLLVPVSVALINAVGWRHTLEIYAVGSILIGVPMSFIVKDPKADVIEMQKAKESRQSKSGLERFLPKDILKNRLFWLLSAALLLAAISTTAISTHQIPYMVSVGLTRSTAAWLVVVFSLSNAIGRLGWGVLGDKLDKRYCFTFAAIFLSIGLVVFAFADEIGKFFPALMLMGIGIGGVITLRPMLQLHFFGFNSFATVQGLTMVLVTAGTMASPPLAGWVYDTFNQYRPAWLALAVLSIFSIPVILATSGKKVEPLPLVRGD